jgi:hypothetical protein
MSRNCFLAPDVSHTERCVALLRHQGIAQENIAAIANQGLKSRILQDCGGESNDFLPAYARGVSIGGVMGWLAGLAAVAFPPIGVVLGSGAILASTLATAGLGGLISGIAGAGFTNSSLNEFKDAIAAGKLLIIAEIPADRVDTIEGLIRLEVPSIALMGTEPATPVFG